MIDFEEPKPHLELRAFLRGLAVREIRPHALAADRSGRTPETLLEALEDCFRNPPKEVGGDPKLEKTHRHRRGLIPAEELSFGDAAISLSLPGPGLGEPPVRSMGTPEQKKRFFAPFAEPGLRWGAYALTEPGAGSDVSAIQTRARRVEGGYILDGTKAYCTNGARADWVVVFATIDPALGRRAHRAFVVPKGARGFRVGRIEEKLGLRASETAELVLEECFVPDSDLLGGEDHYRSNEGFVGAMKTFDASRPLVAAMAVGIGRAAFEQARDLVNADRPRSPARRQAIEEQFGEMHRALESSRLLAYRAAWLQDQGLPNAKEAAIAKAYAAKSAMAVCRAALEVAGSNGVAADLFLEKWFRDIKVFDIFEGTAQIQRIVIAKRILSNPPATF